MRGLFKLLVLVTVSVLILNMLACGGGEVVEQPPEGEIEEEPPVVGYQIAEANEQRTELSPLLSIAVDTGVEIAEYCDTFWETWRDGTKEEMLQLAQDHPKMVTKVGVAKANLDSALAIIDEAKALNIPNWYQDYFSKKEQVAGYLATTFQQAEAFLAGVKPIVENMSDFISAGEGIINFWEEALPEIGSLINQGNYSEARQRVATLSDTIDDMVNIFIRAYDQAGVPILQWFRDRCSSLGEVIILVSEWLEAKQAGNVAQVDQLRSEIEAFCYEELEILQSIPWEESNTWFEENFGSFLDQITTNTGQAVSLNSETDSKIEVALEARWTPTADESEQVFYAYFTGETGDVRQWEEGAAAPKVVRGHPEIDIKNAHTRVQGDNIIFWLEVEGSISDESGIGYMFSVCTAPESKEGDAQINYMQGKASCYVRATREYTYPEFQKSGGGLRIIVPKSAFDSPDVWSVHVMTFAGEGLQDTVGELPPGL